MPNLKTTTLTGADLLKRRRAASMTIDAAASAITTRLGRLVPVLVLASWENGFINIPTDFELDMIAPLGPIPIPDAKEPKELWRQLEHRLKPSALAAAKAMCQIRDDGDQDKRCPCSPANEKACHAFALFGREAVAATIAIDAIQAGRLHAGVYAVDWTVADR